MTIEKTADPCNEGKMPLEHLGASGFSDEFIAQDAAGKWRVRSLETLPFFNDALRMAREPYREGRRDLFEAAVRGGELQAANKALNAGQPLEDATWSPPSLLRVTAEQLARRAAGQGRP